MKIARPEAGTKSALAGENTQRASVHLFLFLSRPAHINRFPSCVTGVEGALPNVVAGVVRVRVRADQHTERDFYYGGGSHTSCLTTNCGSAPHTPKSHGGSFGSLAVAHSESMRKRAERASAYCWALLASYFCRRHRTNQASPRSPGPNIASEEGSGTGAEVTVRLRLGRFSRLKKFLPPPPGIPPEKFTVPAVLDPLILLKLRPAPPS